MAIAWAQSHTPDAQRTFWVTKIEKKIPANLPILTENGAVKLAVFHSETRIIMYQNRANTSLCVHCDPV